MQKARIRNIADPSNRRAATLTATQIIEVQGPRGGWTEVFRAKYWPDSPKSGEAHDRKLYSFCRDLDLEVISENGFKI